MSNIEDKEIEVFGRKLTVGTIGIILTVLSTAIGVLWYLFQLQQKIDSIEDMASYNARLVAVEENTNKVNDYTRDIKNDLKNDVRKLEKIVEQVERDNKQFSREIDRDLREIRKEVDVKIKRALDNPLANKE
jgi:cell division protein ZapA (FtsZ GTPase activity inhibitor)